MRPGPPDLFHPPPLTGCKPRLHGARRFRIRLRQNRLQFLQRLHRPASGPGGILADQTCGCPAGQPLLQLIPLLLKRAAGDHPFQNIRQRPLQLFLLSVSPEFSVQTVREKSDQAELLVKRRPRELLRSLRTRLYRQ